MRKVGIITVYTINNYGSTLQTYSLQKTIESLGYEPYGISLQRSRWERIIKRIKNRMNLGFRVLRYPMILKRTLDFKQSGAVIRGNTSESLKMKYEEFTNGHIHISSPSSKTLKIQAKQKCNFAYICGSDQIWQGAMVLINKNAFLRFAPKHKRISYAPSFGGTIEHYNKKVYKKYINEIPYLSIRELQGADEIKALTNREAVVALDPTLLVTNEFWQERAILPDTKEDYILCYFLNEPSPLAIKHIAYLVEKYNCKIKLIPYANKISEKFKVEVCEPSPFEFLGYVDKAKFVCTDSFHGVAFSISYNKDFFVYHREYTHSYKQTSRIDSILTIMELNGRLIENEDFENKKDKIDYTSVNVRLEQRRKISLDFLTNSLNKIGEENELF